MPNKRLMLKILTLNIQYYEEKHGSWPSRKEVIAELIRENEPEIVVLQAVAKDPEREDGKDQALQLCELLPDYKYVYFQSADPDSGAKEKGSAFISSIPFADTQYMKLSFAHTEDNTRRVLLGARFELSSGDLYLFNGHFSWVYDQAKFNFKEAFPYINDVNGYALLTGDLNIKPGSDLFLPLKEAGWMDAWKEIHPDKPGYTYESDFPSIRIDYAWINPALKNAVKDVKVVQKERGNIRLSDHLALMVTLDLGL